MTAEAAAPPPTALAPSEGKEDSSKGNETLKNTLLTLEKAWLASDGKPGTDTYGQFLADDFVHIAPNGEKSDKAGNLRALQERNGDKLHFTYDRLDRLTSVVRFRASTT